MPYLRRRSLYTEMVTAAYALKALTTSVPCNSERCLVWLPPLLRLHRCKRPCKAPAVRAALRELCAAHAGHAARMQQGPHLLQGVLLAYHGGEPCNSVLLANRAPSDSLQKPAPPAADCPVPRQRCICSLVPPIHEALLREASLINRGR